MGGLRTRAGTHVLTPAQRWSGALRIAAVVSLGSALVVAVRMYETHRPLVPGAIEEAGELASDRPPENCTTRKSTAHSVAARKHSR